MTSKQTGTPNELLATVIVERLIASELLSEKRRDEVTRKLVAGTAKSEDWNLWIELGVAGEGADHDTNP